MNINRSDQFAKMRILYELRERESLVKLHEQKKSVNSLELTAKKIRGCVDKYVIQLKTLDDRRLQEDSLTVVMLQEDVANRLIVQRDLGKERIYLNTALKDIKVATDELAIRRSQWCVHVKRLEALTMLEQNQRKLEIQLDQVDVDRELDDLAINRHGAMKHG